MHPINVDGKHFAVGDRRFDFRGVTYGTFRPRDDGHRFPERKQIKADFAEMTHAGFTVVRTYTPPPDDVVELAADWGLYLLSDAFYPDWRYLIGDGRRDRRRVMREARATVRQEARRLAGTSQILALSLGNEIPADVVRWAGTRRIASCLAELTEVVREEDPDRLVTYANYPTAEYLPLETLDFLTFNVFLEQHSDFRRYLTRLHHLAGDRPLVLGELGLHVPDDAGAEQRQAEVLEWQLKTVLERGLAGACVFSWTDEWWVGDAAVEGWRFGITREDRTPRPAFDVVRQWNHSTVRDLDVRWPAVSVVICAYNAEATIDECLRHTCALDYPDLEILVVDDGSTDATAEITRRYPRARLVSLPHGGLSVGRNAGYEAAHGEIVAYLDSDAYPPPEWPYYLALGFDGPMVGGVGGPNVPPVDDPQGAQQVARAPGGPVHVLVSDDRAEHIPGCNMAFFKQVLTEVGGCDPIYDAAGDDVDLCWKVLDRGWEIGFHPAALVWHHRRAGARPYFRQQRGYGRAEALVEARHPDRFTPTGTARWRGRIYDSFAPSLARQRVYRGLFGTAAYQSVYRGGGHALDIAHQIGVPTAVAAVLTAPAALLKPALGVVALAGLLFLGLLAGIDIARTRPPRTLRGFAPGFRLGVAWLHLGQPLVRLWGRWRHSNGARRGIEPSTPLPAPVRDVGRGVLLLPADRPRSAMVDVLISVIRCTGLRVIPDEGWQDHDARIIASALVSGELVTSAFPEGCLQVRVRPRVRLLPSAIVAGVIAVLLLLQLPSAAGIAVALAGLEGLRGVLRLGPGSRRAIRRAATT
jgi:O-antigen biosynthesis protein